MVGPSSFGYQVSGFGAGILDLGKLKLLETKEINAETAIFSNIEETKYKIHFLTINQFIPSNDNTALSLRFFESGVEETAAVYKRAQKITDAATDAEFRSSSASDFVSIWNCGNVGGECGNAYYYFYNLGDSSQYSFISGMENHIYYSPGTIRNSFGGAVLPQLSTVDQIKLFVPSGQTFTATASLYGVSE
jgi:hypothetical protein